MKGTFLVFAVSAVLCGCTVLPPEPEAVTGATPVAKLKVGVYCGAGPGGIGAVEWVRLVRSSPEMELKLVNGRDVRAGGLKGLDVLVMPGGSSKSEFLSLGTNGVERMKDFIRGGGGYIGTCAGCCLLMNNPTNRACVIPYDTCGSERDLLFPNYTLNEKGAKALGIRAGDHVIRYHGGPLMRATANAVEGANFEVWGTVNAEATMKGKVNAKKRMHGAVGILGGTYGKGRVFVTSGHPEYFRSTLYFVEAAFRWVTGRTVTFPERARRPRSLVVGLVAKGIGPAITKAVFAVDDEKDCDLFTVNGDGAFQGHLEHLDVLILLGEYPEKGQLRAAADRLLARGAPVFVMDAAKKAKLPEGCTACSPDDIPAILKNLLADGGKEMPR